MEKLKLSDFFPRSQASLSLSQYAMTDLSTPRPILILFYPSGYHNC